MNVRRLGAIAGAISILGGASAIGAGLKTESKRTTLQADETGSATAKCKRGTKVVSGGFSGPLTPNGSLGPQIFPTASTKSGKRRWTASAFNMRQPMRES